MAQRRPLPTSSTEPGTLPPGVVAEDHRLEAEAGRASEALAHHRWHWTLDETNPDRVPLRAYARAVGRDYRTIHGCAHGWQVFTDAGGSITISEAIERARLGPETELAAEAVAEVHGISVGQARKTRLPEIRQVRDRTRTYAVESGQSYEKQVRVMAVAAEVERQLIEAAAQGEGWPEVPPEVETHRDPIAEVMAKLRSAETDLLRANDLAERISWLPEDRMQLGPVLANLDQLLTLIGRKVAPPPSLRLVRAANLSGKGELVATSPQEQEE